jgi:hypothetical protein
MKRILLFALLALALPALLSAEELIRCESKDGHRRRCSFEGPGHVVLRKRLSATTCNEGENWGWKPGEIWVDHGCRAEFVVDGREERREERHEERREEARRDEGWHDRDGGMNREHGRLLVCESEDGRRHRCAADLRFGIVEVNRQLGHRDCILNDTWGWNESGVWVDRGCRAEFVIRPERRAEPRYHTETVLCESRDSHQHFCAAETRFGVELRRQLSVSTCTFGESWGYGERGIWVKNGCRAEFSVKVP